MSKLKKLLRLEFGSVEPIKTYVVYSGEINFLALGLGIAEAMSFIEIEKLANAFCDITGFPKDTIMFWQIISPAAFPDHRACLYIYSLSEKRKQSKIIGAQEVRDVWETRKK